MGFKNDCHSYGREQLGRTFENNPLKGYTISVSMMKGFDVFGKNPFIVPRAIHSQHLLRQKNELLVNVASAYNNNLWGLVNGGGGALDGKKLETSVVEGRH